MVTAPANDGRSWSRRDNARSAYYVLQFVGFIAAWNQPGVLSPFLAGTLGALLTTWATFVPCFIWIFLGAPHIEQLRGNRKLTAALSTVTAAVVGVVLNLAVWFALHVLFKTDGSAEAFVIAPDGHHLRGDVAVEVERCARGDRQRHRWVSLSPAFLSRPAKLLPPLR